MAEGEGGNGEKGQLLGIFPAEMWLLILENVKNAADFQWISNASPYFRTLLQPRATQELFPEVLQILTQQQPPLFHSPVELLPLRQVCHAWNAAVEQVLEDPEYPFMFEREQLEKRYLMKNNPTYVYNNDSRIICRYFNEVEDFSSFQQHFSATQATAHNSSPLFWREVFFDFPQDLRDYPPYFQACLSFLHTYGTHIRDCSIVLDFEDLEHHRQFYRVGLKQLLELMPNLKLVYFSDITLTNHANLRVEPQMQRFLQSVEDSMAATPVPELAHLQMVSVQEFALPFLRALLQRNPQVTILSDASLIRKGNHVSVYLEGMPNLTALELKLNHVDELEALRRVSVTCPLSKLDLSIRWDKVDDWEEEEEEEPTEMEIGPLFRMLEAHFSGTLTDLSLEFHCRVEDFPETGLPLQFPRLRKLRLTFADQLTPLNFVLPLKDTLEQLVVGVRYCSYYRTAPPFSDQEAQAEDRILKLYQFWVEPQKSNAWTLFPKLKLLRTMESRRVMYSCSREQWIAKQPK